jgi:hypothetical protein
MKRVLGACGYSICAARVLDAARHLVTSWPITPPTAAPPTVPTVLPPVTELPAKPPSAAPPTVPIVCRLGVPQADRAEASVTALTTETKVREIICPPGKWIACFTHKRCVCELKNSISSTLAYRREFQNDTSCYQYVLICRITNAASQRGRFRFQANYCPRFNDNEREYFSQTHHD